MSNMVSDRGKLMKTKQDDRMACGVCVCSVTLNWVVGAASDMKESAMEKSGVTALHVQETARVGRSWV